MDPTAFRFNKYKAGASPGDEIYVAGTELIQPSIYLTNKSRDWLEAVFPDLFENYLLRDTQTNALYTAWNGNHAVWRNQLNFAIWCATTDCCVSHYDHVTALPPQITSLYTFHVLYTIRRVLSEIKAALPQGATWSAANNTYDRKAYKRLYDEFAVDKNTSWRLAGMNNRLGRAYYINDDNIGVFDKDYMLEGEYDDYVSDHSGSLASSYKTFITTTFVQDEQDAGKWNGFTQAGVQKINNSIRTYVWCVIGAQANTRTCILGTSTTLEAQNSL